MERLAAVLAKAGMSWELVAESHVLAGGTFNDVHLVRLTDGTRLVVKLPPGPAVRLLRYEQGMAGTEALYYRLAGQREPVTVPAVIAVDDTGLVMTYCPGTPWPQLTPRPAGVERDELRAELGRWVASLHTITGTGFGYPSQALGPLRETWREAFLAMVDAVLEDAGTYAVTLPRPAADIQTLFAGQAAVLDEVTTPVLVHFDLWDGNILVDGDRVGALIDAERAFWGDPLAELVSLALFGDIEQDVAFLNAYRAAGGTVTFDAATRRRLSLYQAYLYLIMWVEAVPRRVSEKRLDWLSEVVLQPLVAMFSDWSGVLGRLGATAWLAGHGCRPADGARDVRDRGLRRARRHGNTSTNNAPRSTYQTGDGLWVAVSASAQSVAERVLRLVGHPEVTAEPWFGTGRGRARHTP